MEWTQQEVDAIENKFEDFYKNKLAFTMNALAFLKMMLEAEDADEMEGERIYYAKIYAAIMEDERESITLEEKVLFINMHVALKNIYEAQLP